MMTFLPRETERELERVHREKMKEILYITISDDKLLTNYVDGIFDEMRFLEYLTAISVLCCITLMFVFIGVPYVENGIAGGL